MADDPTMQRLEDQISWYDRKSRSNQRSFKLLKGIVIVAAAVIPLMAGFSAPAWLTGGLGVLVAVLEGLQQLNQYQANWIGYRSTCEALKHEKYLYLGNAGVYGSAENSRALLAERIESIISHEHALWASSREDSARSRRPGGTVGRT